MNREFQLAAVTPPVLLDPAIAIAASRAGHIGILDLEYSRDERRSHAAIRRLADLGGKECGVKLEICDDSFASSILDFLPAKITVVLLAPRNPELLSSAIQKACARGLRILVEVTSLEQARAARRARADVIIAKGNEAGGNVGEETTFVLIQHLLAELDCPVWAHGGIGLHTASACYMAGAAGAVLDAQLWLSRESSLPKAVKNSLHRIDGSETACLGREHGELLRVYSRPGQSALEHLRALSSSLASGPRGNESLIGEWRNAVKARAGWTSGDDVWLMGQDAAFARPLSETFITTAGILQAIDSAVRDHVRAAADFEPLSEQSPLAQSHHTRFPIVQGPMTRVSDVPSFAERVASSGALPFLAIALMGPEETASLMDETAQLLGERPWGVGILGFVPPEIREQQMAVIRNRRPPFALIAGGRPDQAQDLEREGIPTYLHVPSPDLLKMFLESGSRRFVFEGRECGGHVGPRSSFVLWEQMIEVLLQAIGAGEEASAYHILFAGGIHDSRSSAMVSALSAPLAARGCRIGVLLGTAYLFTDEAVLSGAVVPGFQQEALRCDGTVLLETGPGHDIRCSDTSYCDFFKREKRMLIAGGLPAEDIQTKLETTNLGRLRIASKGIARDGKPDQGIATAALGAVSEERQRNEGMYMIGQVAALRKTICTMQELHADVSENSSAWLRKASDPGVVSIHETRQSRPRDLAIIGMACIFPKAGNLRQYWENILNKEDAIREVPEHRWNWREFFDPNPDAADRVCSRWGGFLDDVPFEPLKYGLPPNSLKSIEPLQLLTLEVVRSALEDAGYLNRPFPRERTSVILGIGGGLSDLAFKYATRSAVPLYMKEKAGEILNQLPDWTEESFPGILQNVAAGRVANRFDLGGVNFTVDAACASSLAAVHMAAHELDSGNSEMVIVGGADTAQNPLGYLCFSKTGALSLRGKCRTFDDSADGIVLSEGVGVVVLKRLAHAERDGDRIYAIIKGVAGSSDGRGKSMTAPRSEGQMVALRRAYSMGGIPPQSISLIEAHGTGTVAGDQAEVDALRRVMEEAGASRASCAVGSVKSMIGHTKSAAGLAGLVKVAMALHHRVLPPTASVDTPNRKARFEESPLYINTEMRPWLRRIDEFPRRAGVSSFGFGGTNFHVALEEYTRDFADRPAPFEEWPSELFLFSAQSHQQLVEQIQRVRNALEQGARPAGRDLAYTLAELYEAETKPRTTVAVVSSSIDNLRDLLSQVLVDLNKPDLCSIESPRGIYFSDRPLAGEGKVAFLFPGQGSQYPDMLRDLAVQFHEVRERFEFADRILKANIPAGLSSYVFPPPRFGEDDEKAARRKLMQTELAQPALAAAEMSLVDLLRSMKVYPEMAAGHSYGEYAALWSAGAFDDQTLIRLSECRGRFIQEEAGTSPGTMAAVDAGLDAVREAIDGLEEVWIANINSPDQTVISGSFAGIDKVADLLAAKGLRVHRLPVACAFHTPIVGAARDRLAEELMRAEFKVPRFEVFSNSFAAPYPIDAGAIAAILADHLVKPVNFAGEVEAMYAAGARIFVEVGPSSVLTGLVGQVLKGRPHRAVAMDICGRSGLVQLMHSLARLVAEGVALDASRLFVGRKVRRLQLENLVLETKEKPLPETVWLVDGGRARPANEPAKRVVSTPPSTATPTQKNAATNIPLKAKVAETVSPAQVPLVANGSGAQARTDVMVQYQHLMNRFLETQQSVMLSYLKGGAGELSPFGHSILPRRAPDAAEMQPQAQVQPLERSPDSNDVIKAEKATAHTSPSGEEEVTQRLIQIVSERTGYPSEMLDLDLNVEADLGINSIKKVEILGAFQRQCTEVEANRLKKSMDKLTTLKTLRAIIAGLTCAFQPAPEPLKAAEHRLPRHRRSLVETPLQKNSVIQAPGGTVLITDDGCQVAYLLASRLSQAGVRVVVLCSDEGKSELNKCLSVDLANRESITAMARKVRAEVGPIAGLLHLTPLRSIEDSDFVRPDQWRKRHNLEVRSLFLLASELASDLSRLPGSRFIAASALGGKFGENPPSGSFFPGHGAIAGFIKSLAREWPEVRCRVVDCDGSAPRDVLADWLFEEFFDDSPEIELGRRPGERFCLHTTPAQLQEDGSPLVELSSESVVLVTGGARGITSAVATEIARRYHPTLYLAGRSELPAAEESERTAGISAPHELKKVLIEDCRARGELPSPGLIEQACQKILTERQMRAALRGMREAGARVHYECVNVCDGSSVADLLNRIYQAHGRLDGVIHGAGIIEDGLVAGKSPDSFDRVFDTKVFGALELVRNLRPESLQFLAFFSSVAGIFGNRGQADYGAANEALNKLGLALDRSWKARVVSINWGPWADIGMVSPEVARGFAERGVQLIAPEAGQSMFLSELIHGSKGEVEVILGDGPWTRVADAAVAANGNHHRQSAQLPLIDHLTLPREGPGAIDFTYMVSADKHTYLADHRLDSNAVMPAAIGLELMAEVVQHLCPDLKVTGARDFAVMNGVVLQNGAMPIRISARHDNHSGSARHVTVLIRDPSEDKRLYTGTIILADGFDRCEHVALQFHGLGDFPITVQESYERLLFHGPALRGIEQVHGFGSDGMSATLTASSPSRLLRGVTAEQWLIDPLVLDSAFQLGLIWARLNFDITVLPVRFARFRRFRPLTGSRVRCTLASQGTNEHQSLHTTITFSDEVDNVLWQIEDMEFCGSNALNRLGGSAMRGNSG